MKKTINNPLTTEATGAAAMAVPTFALAEMLFHVNPVSGGILAGIAGLLGWNGIDVAFDALDACLNYQTPRPNKQGKGTPERAPKSTERLPESKGIILGKDKFGKEIVRELKQLKNILIMGAPGNGKSSLACYLLSQMAVNYGARFIVIDKNAKGGESLTTRFSMFEHCFLLPPAYKAQDICDSIEYARTMLEKRQEGDEDTSTPLILVVDEFTRTCMDERTKHITSVVEDYNALGRQFNCFSLCCGQLTNASRTGGTEVRELFATRMILGMKEAQAKMILGNDKALSQQVARLEPGECICDTEGKDDPFKFTFPNKSVKYYREQALRARQETTSIDQNRQDFSNSSLDHSDHLSGPPEDHQDASDINNSMVVRGQVKTTLLDAFARYKGGESIRSIGAPLGITSGDDRKALKELLDSLGQAEEPEGD